MHKRYIFILCFVFCFFCFVSFSFADEKIIAIVNADVVTQKDLNDFINFMRIKLSSEYKGRALSDKLDATKKDLVEKLVEDKLILQEAKKSGVKIDNTRIKAKIEDMKKGFSSSLEFQQALAREGMVEADIENKIREQMLMYNIVEERVRRKIIIHPAEVTEFYNKNTASFNTPEEREVVSLAVDKETLAKEIVDFVKTGKPGLEDAAAKYSITLNKLNVARTGELRKDIEEAVFSLKPGELSQAVKIEDKFYLFRVDNIILPRQQNLDEAREIITSLLYERKMQEGLDKWLGELKKNAFIKIISG
ncbi:hypothetical protein EPO66_01115 [bacterium]|nr:MAG: hypothetical protein EPO66_01115 [bacterium]